VIDPDALAGALRPHLTAQRWFAGSAADEIDLTVDEIEIMRAEWPILLRVVVSAAGTRWHLPLGVRPPDRMGTILEGKPNAAIGTLDTDQGHAVVYDAMVDHELSIELLHTIDPSLSVTHVRPLGADQSNTSVVFDEQVVLKLFRQLGDGANEDVEVPAALGAVGFTNVPRLLGVWRHGNHDLATLSEFLSGAVDGFHLALTSLHDALASGGPPAEAGGDFAPDARRLGMVTAQLHLSMAEAFGVFPSDVEQSIADMVSQLARSSVGRVDAIREIYESLRDIELGPAIRLHGDFHLGQAMRTDAGWYIVDFEGEPARPRDERKRPAPAVRDVAGMLRSFHYAAEVGLRDFGYSSDADARLVAGDWQARNEVAFLDGYNDVPGIRRLLPPDLASRRLVLSAFLIDKAVYEVGYETAHRPDWAEIPLSAIDRIVGGSVPK
jgi:maltokinase